MRILEGVTTHGMAEASRLAEGWAIPRPGERYHYFVKGKAICGCWSGYSGPTWSEEASCPSRHECQDCRIIVLSEQIRSAS